MACEEIKVTFTLVKYKNMGNPSSYPLFHIGNDTADMRFCISNRILYCNIRASMKSSTVKAKKIWTELYINSHYLIILAVDANTY